MSARLANVVFARTTGRAPGRGTNRDLSISLSLAVIFSSFFSPAARCPCICARDCFFFRFSMKM